MINANEVRELMQPFEIVLAQKQLDHLLVYLELLLRWNRKISLTAIHSPQECVTRHFAESLYLSRWVRLVGRSLDVGSGAGFPGLALKIVFSELATTLLEPVAKKRAFLKEVARACEMEAVEVRPERIKEYAIECLGSNLFDSVTSRAVGGPEELTRSSSKCLKPGGKICLWLTNEGGQKLVRETKDIGWFPPVQIPGSRQRSIWIGTRAVCN